jgi:formate/nitrite transporter FocA (FNT family)
VLDLQGIARLKEDRRMIDKLAVQDGIDTDDIFIDLWLNFVWHVIIDGVTHIFGQYILETLLIELVIIENFHQNVQEAFVLVGVETYFENLVISAAILRVYLILIFKDIIKDLLNHAQTWFEHNIWEFSTPENSLLHVFQPDVFKPEYFLSVVISDKGALHASNLALHDVFKEATSD